MLSVVLPYLQSILKQKLFTKVIENGKQQGLVSEFLSTFK